MKWWSQEQTLQQRVDSVSKEADWRPQIAAVWGEIQGIRRESEIKEEAIAKALELQAGKYEQRLENLNHENARIQEAQAKSVSRELYDAGVRETLNFRETVNKTLATSITHRASLQSAVDQVAGDLRAVGERITGVERTLMEKVASTDATLSARIVANEAALAARITALEKSDLTRRSAIGGVSDLGRALQLIMALIIAAGAVYFLFVPK